MKKLLSVVLALVMVLSTVAALIPTAWAEPSDPAGGDGTPATSTRPEGSWVYYEQNFDDEALASLTNAELATALGWDAPTADNHTLTIEDGAFRFVSINKTKGKYSTELFARGDDTRMNSSITVIEYDLEFQSSRLYASQSANVSMSSSDGNTSFMTTFFNEKGEIEEYPMAGTHKLMNGNALNLGMFDDAQLRPLKDIPVAEEATNCADTEYHVKAVVDPVLGTYYMTVNGVVVATLSDTENFGGSLHALIDKMTETFTLEFSKGADILLDNIQIYGYESSAPTLVVTEIANNGGAGYQWIELYNSTLAPINVFDYALYVNNDPAANTVFGDTNLGCFAGFGETVYADGTLQSGETAVVLLPFTAAAADMDVTSADAFRTAIGAPADVKAFVCDNDTLALTSTEAMVVGLMEVDGETGEGKYVGLDDALRMFLESYVIVTSSAIDSNKGYEGLALHEGLISYGLNLGEAGKTLELTYWGVRTEKVTSRLGEVKYDASAARETASGEDGTQTPGYIPSECRFDVSFTVYDENGENPVKKNAKFMELWSDPSHDTKDHYKLVGYSVNGSTEYVDEVLLSEDGLHVVPVYVRTSPYAQWYQVSELDTKGTDDTSDDTYTVRILGGINRKDIYSAGFRYSYKYTNEKGREILYMPESSYVCTYVYESVIADGETVTAADLGCEYLFAIHITDIPAGSIVKAGEGGEPLTVPMVSDLTITVSSFIVDETTRQTVWSEQNVFTVEPPVAPVE